MVRVYNEVYCNVDYIELVERGLRRLMRELPPECEFDMSFGASNWQVAEDE